MAAAPGADGEIPVEGATFETVCEAIRLLYATATEHALRQKVDRFLQRFKEAPQAWAIADQLLTQDPFESSDTYQRVFFGALTMHDKIRYDFRDLPDSLIPNLRDTLLKHIGRLNDGLNAVAAAAPGSPAPKITVGSVRKLVHRLCLAYAALVVQSSESGDTVVGTIGTLFPPATHGHILIGLLTALPDEATSPRVRGKTQRREAEFLAGLARMAHFMLPLMTQMLQQATERRNFAMTEACFRCFGSWALYVGLNASDVAANLILDYLFAAASSAPQLFDVAFDTLQDLVRAFRWANAADHPVLARLLPGILALEPLYDEAVATDDDDRTSALAYLFTDAVDRAIEFLMLRMHHDAALETLKHTALRLLVKVSSHPDVAVGAKPFPFWIHLGHHFHGLDRCVRAAGATAAASFRLLLCTRCALPAVFALCDLLQRCWQGRRAVRAGACGERAGGHLHFSPELPPRL